MVVLAYPRRPLSCLLTGLVIAYLTSVILFSYRDGITVVAKIAGGALIGGFVASALLNRRPIEISRTYVLWGIWLGISICSVALAERAELAALKALTLVQLLPTALILTNVILWHGSTRFYWKSIVGLGIISCVAVWIDPISFSDVDGRVFGPMGNANAFGAMLVTCLIFAAIAGFERMSVAQRVLWISAAGTFFLMILRTGSRQALLGSLVAVVVILASRIYRARDGSWRWWSAVTVVGTVITLGMLLASHSTYWFRMESMFSAARGDLGDVDTSLVERAHLYKRAGDIALQNPVLGIGLDNFRAQPRFPGAGPIGTYSHSNYAEVLVSTGIVGFVLYFSVFALWALALYRVRYLLGHPDWYPRYMRIMAITSSYLIMDFATVSYYNKFVWLVFPLVIAEIVSMERAPVLTVSRDVRHSPRAAQC